MTGYFLVSYRVDVFIGVGPGAPPSGAVALRLILNSVLVPQSVTYAAEPSANADHMANPNATFLLNYPTANEPIQLQIIANHYKSLLIINNYLSIITTWYNRIIIKS